MRCAGPCTGGGQQEQAGPLERAADPSGIGAELGDDLLLEIEWHTDGGNLSREFGHG
jgi:hypothetical protein